MNFIRPTDFFSDLSLMKQCTDQIIKQVGWGFKDQIGLTHRPRSNDSWFDAAGSLYNRETKKFIAEEKDFTEFNAIPEFLLNSFNELSAHENIKFGRIRIMRLVPRRGLSIHYDSETRYHYVIDTNPKSYMCLNNNQATGLEPRAQCYHIPMDGQWYHVDTRKTHWVYNGGDTDRIHLVISTV